MYFAGAATYPAGTILARDSSTGNLIPYVRAGNTNGNGIPRALLTCPLTAAGVGAVSARVMLTGVVNKARLVIRADGVDGAEKARKFGAQTAQIRSS